MDLQKILKNKKYTQALALCPDDYRRDRQEALYVYRNASKIKCRSGNHIDFSLN